MDARRPLLAKHSDEQQQRQPRPAKQLRFIDEHQQQQHSSGDGARKRPRHLIGHWQSIGQLHGGSSGEWRIPYRELEPASYYV